MSPAVAVTSPPPERPAAPPDPQAAREARRDAARRWASPTFATPSPDEYNRPGLDYRHPLPRPPVVGRVVDAHTHLLAARHAPTFFEACDAFGIDHVATMTPLEEAAKLLGSPYGPRVTLIAVPAWEPGGYDPTPFWRRVEAFRNLGAVAVKFHLAPQTMVKTGLALGSDRLRRYLDKAADLGLIVMTHVGDPRAWYEGRYADDPELYGTRDAHYDAWERHLDELRGHPWWGAHLGGLPDDLPRLADLLDRFPDLTVDTSATKWIVRDLCRGRDGARQFVVKYADRLVFGTDQVSHDTRGYDFLASRLWCHRKLWETAFDGPSPVADPDHPGHPDTPPPLHGLALPDDVLQKLYVDNPSRLLSGG